MECQNITSLSCDLTAETPSLPIVFYYAEVHATGHPTRVTYRWLPIIDSKTHPRPPPTTLRLKAHVVRNSYTDTLY